jgi:glycine C-acetyltransferase
MLLLSAYDYLGLIGHPDIERASVRAVEMFGTGTGGVRLLTGTNQLHRELEASIAEVKNTGEAAVFTSGYLANLAAITALFGPQDRVLLDECSHRSTIDACRLAHVPHHRFRHNDPDHLEALLREGRPSRTLVVVEGIYSMDGDVCRLPEIVDVKNRYGAFLLVDEAHAIGVLGARGRGTDEEFGLPSSAVDLWMGSLSKAIPSVGGYLAGDPRLIGYLRHGSGPFMFSAALGPPAAAAALEALEVIRSEPWRVSRARSMGDRLREGLLELGFDTGPSATPVVPVIVGDRDDAIDLSRRLWDEQVLASAIIAPAVPSGMERLRLCATAAHSDDDLGDALAAFERVRDA